jgi:hypothetical protein
MQLTVWPFSPTATINGLTGEEIVHSDNLRGAARTTPALHDFFDCEHLGVQWDATSRTFYLTLNGVLIVRIKRPEAITFVGLTETEASHASEMAHQPQD